MGLVGRMLLEVLPELRLDPTGLYEFDPDVEWKGSGAK
jgi:hypothetical protein